MQLTVTRQAEWLGNNAVLRHLGRGRLSENSGKVGFAKLNIY